MVIALGRRREAVGLPVRGQILDQVHLGIEGQVEGDALGLAARELELPEVEFALVDDLRPVRAHGRKLDAVLLVERHLDRGAALGRDLPNVERTVALGEEVDHPVRAPHGHHVLAEAPELGQVGVGQLPDFLGRQVLDVDLGAGVALVAFPPVARGDPVEGHHLPVLGDHAQGRLVHGERRRKASRQADRVEGRAPGPFAPVRGEEDGFPSGVQYWTASSAVRNVSGCGSPPATGTT